MAKYHGIIGFAIQHEPSPGVYVDEVVEREYFGDVISSSFANQQSSLGVNDDLRLNNRISIVSNTFAIENLAFMRYITYMGVKWKISNIEPQYPRLILSIGGVYNA